MSKKILVPCTPSNPEEINSLLEYNLHGAYDICYQVYGDQVEEHKDSVLAVFRELNRLYLVREYQEIEVTSNGKENRA